VQKNSDNQTPEPSSRATEVTGVIPESIQSNPVSSYRVKSGDTLTQIAKHFGIPVSKIARLNNLGPTSLMRVGQNLQLTGSEPKKAVVESYRVKAGDSLSAIAEKHGLTLQELTAVNRISSSSIIYPGQVLRVAKVLTATAPAANAAQSYQVRAGDSLEVIAKRLSVDLSTLREINGLSINSIIYVGQVLSLNSDKKPQGQIANGQNDLIAATVSTNAEPVRTVQDKQTFETDNKRPSGACTLHGLHTVLAGETVGRIAAVYGVSTQAVLSANSLNWSSTIYVGQQLNIPGVHEILNCPSIPKLTPEMRANAETIYQVGRNLEVSNFGIVVALATAMQESSLKNIDFGEQDSAGLFQQAPSKGFGSVDQIMNPEYSTRAFFGGPTGPNFGKRIGLLDVENWPSLSLTEAAQAVQHSALPNSYQRWELAAWSWLDLIEAGYDG
jgi:LysM repeat protein